MSTYVLTAQDVAGDPLREGGEIVILKGATSTLIFSDVGESILARDTEARVSIAGVGSDLTFTNLGYGDVRGNPAQHALFIRIAMANGGFKVVAIDLKDDGAPELASGATGLTVKSLHRGEDKPFPVSPASFTGGTLVRTESGDCMVEDLLPGMKIWTLDKGYVRLRKTLRTKVDGTGRSAPILFCAGSIDNEEPLLLSPNHRLHFEDADTGKEELIPAKLLVNGKTIVRMSIPVVEYYHLVLDDYQLLDTYGVLSEYFHPAPVAISHPAPVKPAAPVAPRPWMSAVEFPFRAAPVTVFYA